MRSGRRALLLAGCSILLGTLAASDVAGREAALRRAIGFPVPVVVAARDLRAGERLGPRALAVRIVPERYAPRGRYGSEEALAGLRAGVAIPAGADIQRALLAGDGSAPVASGERVTQLVAIGDRETIVPGVGVDVVVTRDRGSGAGRATLALQDAEVLAVRPAPPGRQDDGQPRVSVALRTTAAQAVGLAEAQDFARELRLLPRAHDDHQRLRNPANVP